MRKGWLSSPTGEKAWCVLMKDALHGFTGENESIEVFSLPLKTMKLADEKATGFSVVGRRGVTLPFVAEATEVAAWLAAIKEAQSGSTEQPAKPKPPPAKSQPAKAQPAAKPQATKKQVSLSTPPKPSADTSEAPSDALFTAGGELKLELSMSGKGDRNSAAPSMLPAKSKPGFKREGKAGAAARNRVDSIMSEQPSMSEGALAGSTRALKLEDDDGWGGE